METLSLGTFSEDGFMISSTPTVLWEVHNFLFCVRQTRTCMQGQAAHGNISPSSCSLRSMLHEFTTNSSSMIS